MTLVCGKCDERITNPFYTVQAVYVDKENRRIAASPIEIALCTSERELFQGGIKDPYRLNQGVAFAINSCEGREGPLGGVQFSWGWNSKPHLYVKGETLLERIPEITQETMLCESKRWQEFLLKGKKGLNEQLANHVLGSGWMTFDEFFKKVEESKKYKAPPAPKKVDWHIDSLNEELRRLKLHMPQIFGYA